MVSRFTRHVFLTVFVLLIAVFISGILLGRHIESSQESEVQSFLRENELTTESYLIEQELIRISGEKGCDLAKKRIDDLSTQLYYIGQRISVEDADKVLGPADYSLLKRRYHLLQIRTYLLYQQLADRCGIDRDILLYYYGDDGGLSRLQGEVLDRLVANQQVIVFAIEYNYSREINFLESYFNITSTPSVVVNFNATVKGLAGEDNLSQLMNQK